MSIQPSSANSTSRTVPPGAEPLGGVMSIPFVWMGAVRSYLDNRQREAPCRGHVRRDPGDEPVPASLPARDRHLPPTCNVTGWRDGNEHDRDHRDQQCEARMARDPGPAKPLHDRIARLDRLQQGCPVVDQVGTAGRPLGVVLSRPGDRQLTVAPLALPDPFGFALGGRGKHQ